LKYISLGLSCASIIFALFVNFTIEFCKRRSEYSSKKYTTPIFVLVSQFIASLVMICYYIYLTIYNITVPFLQDNVSNKESESCDISSIENEIIDNVYYQSILISSIGLLVTCLSLMFKSTRYVSHNIVYALHAGFFVLLSTWLEDPLAIIAGCFSFSCCLLTAPHTYKSKMH